MPSFDILNEVVIRRTPRLLQLEGMFDLPADKASRFEMQAELPVGDGDPDWNIGLVVGPSGSGKSSLARTVWPDCVVAGFDWPDDKSVVDGFPPTMSIKKIAGLLSSVGFSSPPAWQRPFRCLSNGEQFRVSLARALAEGDGGVTVYDEFTSVVDRTVAKIGSAAVAKTVRREGLKFVAVTCHHDVEEWLTPDWVFDTATAEFRRGSLRRRPAIGLTVRRCSRREWDRFRRHHYLNTSIATSAQCFVGEVEGQPAAFTAVRYLPHGQRPGWSEHRTVCLPDFQGVGIGNAMSELVAGVYSCLGLPYRSVTSHPAMIAHRARSPIWTMTRKPSVIHSIKSKKSIIQHQMKNVDSSSRFTASFEYVGPRLYAQARVLGVAAKPRQDPALHRNTRGKRQRGEA